jgi:hypothetical protein
MVDAAFVNARSLNRAGDAMSQEHQEWESSQDEDAASSSDDFFSRVFL